jgi:hypothetical protein
MAEIKSLLKPEGSVILGAAVIGIVAGIYELNVGSIAQVRHSPSNLPANTSSIKKAGYTSLVAVGGIAILARDPNIVILGGAAIIAMHWGARHANMVNPANGKMEAAVGPSAYQDAQQTPLSAAA